MKARILIITMVLLALGCISQEKTLTPIEEIIGNSYFDVQTTRSMQNRIYFFSDGTSGAVWNLAFNYPSWDDLGIGYNFFDGTNWGEWATESITSEISKNPSYTKYGQNGEIVASEGENGLFINYRMIKGQGNWEEFVFPGPSGFEKLFSPQIVTTGSFNEIIHLLALRKDTSNQFEDVYQDNVGKVLYSRSNDYGITWEILNHEFSFNSDYFGFSELSVVWAEPIDNSLAFVVGDYYTDLILMKSMDAGNTWQKTIIWEHPFPFFVHNVSFVDTFWANSGSQSLAFGSDSKVHLSFAVTCIISDTLNWTGHYDWWADGIVYWNEDRPVYSNNINALNTTDHPDSELIDDYSLIGWSQDINCNDTLDILPTSVSKNVYPSLGLSTMPSIFVLHNQINIVWSSVTEGYDDGNSNFRHLWIRSSSNNGDYWTYFDHLTSGLTHIFDESVFPVFAAYPDDDYLRLIYQHDHEPGLQDENIGTPGWSENKIGHMEIYYENPFYLFLLFYADQTIIYAGDTVNYTNNSYGSPGPISYQWYFEGGTPEESNEKHPSIIYYNEGIFDVMLIGSNDLYTDTVVFEKYINILPQTDIPKITKPAENKIYPNPSSGRFSICTPTNLIIELRVLNLLGDVILKKTIEYDSELIHIDLTGNPDGIYFLEMTYGSDKKVYKILLNN